MNLFLSPHNDDEALFGSYLLLRHKPLVVVCFQGRRARHLPRKEVRNAESAAAMRVLGCDLQCLDVVCDPPGWHRLERLLGQYEPEHVWAPLPEENGHPEHNGVGELAERMWPDMVTFYATYTNNGDTRSVTNTLVDVEPGWPELKRAALACYVTQNSKPDTSFHFERPLDEYVTQGGGVKLNLGGGINPLPGFVNLDKSTGWRFEDGLPYQDRSVAAITVSHTLMYVDPADWPSAFDEMYRVLKDGGVLRVTEDAIGGDGSGRNEIRPGAKVATSLGMVLDEMTAAGFVATPVVADASNFHDASLIQRNYGDPPDVFHAEGLKT